MTQRDEPQPVGSLILYQSEDGRTRIECQFEEENLRKAMAQMALLFEITPRNGTASFAEGELAERATRNEYLQVRSIGARQVSRFLSHCSLPAILSVGYREPK